MFDQGFFERILSQTFHPGVMIKSIRSTSGGCINNTYRLETDQGYLFVKWNQDEDERMFETEAMGLKLLKSHFVYQIPEVFGWGQLEGKNYLVMEYVVSGGHDSNYWRNFGEALALLHQVTNHQFGLDYPNFIGKLPQYNNWMDQWVDFFIEKRLEVQLEMAYKKGLVNKKIQDQFQKLYMLLPHIFPVEPPALLHGDLWSGNVITGSDGNACIIDPAVFYGAREAELSFTQLFGGFDSDFYRAYDETYPLSPGFDERVEVYNLYPLLVHLNLFGSSYLGSIQSILKRYQ